MGNSESTHNIGKGIPHIDKHSYLNFDLNIDKKGDVDTVHYREQAIDIDSKKEISLWHDIKLYPTIEAEKYNVINMVNEIPRCSRKKFEIATNEPGNPIKQDVKKGKLREFGKGDVYFNYGCIPRTWEDPDYTHPDANAKGDNDPLDVCEIGLKIMGVCEVTPVKILGCLCLIDEGEADWKMIAISVYDPWCGLLNDIKDVEEKLPGCLESIREWFRTYKIPDGKPPNVFGLEERFMNAKYAMQIVHETHESWKQLVTGQRDLIHNDSSTSPMCESVSSDNVNDSLAPAKRDVSDTASGDDADVNQPIKKIASSGSMKRNLSYPKLSLEDLQLHTT